MSSNLIEIIGLNYKNVFDNFSIAFEKNKFITLSGPNKCGKTTLLRIIEGEISIPNSILIKEKKQEEYKITDLSTLIKKVIPHEISFARATVEEELYFNIPKSYPTDLKTKRIKEIAKQFKLSKTLPKQINTLTDKEEIILALAIATLSEPLVILIDDLYPFFTKKELLDITKSLKKINKESKIGIIMVTSNLDISLESDYIYIINESKIVLEGIPIKVLEKDNILNKAGLNLPFMMDLSVKLRDYDLIKKIELDMEEMVNTLWN